MMLSEHSENRLTTVSGATSASFVYDAVGNRVKSVLNGVTTCYVGNHFEWTGNTTSMVKYYYAGSQRVAMRQGSSTLYFLLGDHLGSTSLTANSNGTLYTEQRYHPWGDTRYNSPTATPTAYQYTGQRKDATGLYFYNARFYDPLLGRFLSADSIVPSPANPQSLNRYAYVLNNPLRYTDPSGHFSPEQLEQWFGKNWRDLFTQGWQDLLSEGEFGDVVTYGDLSAVLVANDGVLAGWNLDTRAVSSIEEMAGNSGELALYRPYNANQAGGPTENTWLTFGEATPPHNPFYSPDCLRVLGDPQSTNATFRLPNGWYMGADSHVAVTGYWAGFKTLEIADALGLVGVGLGVREAVKEAGKLAGRTIVKGAGGVFGIVAMAVDIASWTTWDTQYTVAPGSGTPPIMPVPTPPPFQ